MAEFSKIEWCDATWNPWMGCTRVSEGCKNCYMERWAKRSGRDAWTVQRSKTTFNAPLKWKEPKRIFVCSLSDFFHPDADEWRREALGIMNEARQHTFLILTKRIELAHKYNDLLDFLPHVWIGVTVENQKHIGRVGKLYGVSTMVRFVSAEPLLGPLDLSEHMKLIDWVIVGGESGANARYMSPAWARIIKYQCEDNGVPFFIKQMTKKAPIPDDLMIREFPDD